MLSMYKHTICYVTFLGIGWIYITKKEREIMVVQGNEQKTMTYKSHVRGQN